MSRSISSRERKLLSALVLLGVLVLWFADHEGAGQSALPASFSMATLGAAPNVSMELLERHGVDLDPQGRDLFRYFVPVHDPQIEPQAERVTQVEIPRADDSIVATEPVRQPAGPAPPGFRYLGHIGAPGDRIAVFDRAGSVVLAQVGDSIGDDFALLKFRHGGVVLRYRDPRFADRTAVLTSSPREGS